MRVEPFKFKEFDAGMAPIRAGGKTFLPGGRRRGEGPPPPPPTYNQEQLKAAERESYKKGFLEGTAEGKKLQDSEQAAADRKLSEALQSLANFTAPLFADYRATAVQIKEETAKIALAIARKVAGPALEQNAQAVVEETVAKCVSVVTGEPKLVITVHTSLVEALKPKVEQMAKARQGAADIGVQGDDALPVTDCRVEWKHGAFARDTQALWKELERAVEGLSASAKHETEARVDALPEQAPAQPEALPETKPETKPDTTATKE